VKEFVFRVNDAAGLHARPAGLLVKCAKACQSQITIIKDEKQVDATRLMAVMGLGVKKGECITIRVIGETENTDIATIQTFLEENV